MDEKLVFNDLVFQYHFKDIYELTNAIEYIYQVFIEFMTIRRNVKLIYDGDLLSEHLMPDYTMAKLLNNQYVSKDKKRVLLRTFSKLSIIDIKDIDDFFEYEGNISILCSYAIRNKIPVVSMVSNSILEKPYLIGKNHESKNVTLHNISRKEHIAIHSEFLCIRIYEMNPKHKLGSNWGSPMDLDDATAQKVLDSAQIYDADDKCLVNKFNNNYYVFRRHIGIYYHGYINNNIPENVKRRFIDV